MLETGRQRARLLVNVSGKILPNDSESQTNPFPFELSQLEKIKECPISWEKVGEKKPLAETPWKFIGFIGEGNEIRSHPACEEEYFGLNFSGLKVNDSKAYISSHEFPDAMIMKIETFVWFRPSSGTKAYYPISHNQLIPTYGMWSNQFHPGPATAPWDNLNQVPRQMKEKYDSLGYLLSSNDTVDYFIEQNILRLSNAKRSLEALFVAEGKEEQ